MIVSEETLPRISNERDHLQRTNNTLSQQLEHAQQRLAEEKAERQQLEEKQGARHADVEASWTKVLEEKQNNWEAKEVSLSDKIENQDRLLKELKASYEVSQRLDHDQDDADGPAHGLATAAELDILNSDLERTSIRLAEVEARNESLTRELASAASSGRRKFTIEDEPAYIRLQSENSSLLRKVDDAKFASDGKESQLEQKIRQAERQKSQVLDENEELKRRLHRVSDYDEMRRELQVLRSIELSIGDDDEVVPGDVQMNGSAAKIAGESLEKLLLARNKKLSDEMTVLRMSYRALQDKLGMLQIDLSNSKIELERSQKLSSTLENDLAHIQEASLGNFPSSTMSVAGTYSSRYLQSTRRGRASPTSSIISGYETQPRTPTSTMESVRAGEPLGGGSGILPMIQAQRDRFKQKNSQLEEELQKTYVTVTSLRQEVASLQKDNLNLYEKTRFVSTYNRGQPTTSSSASYSQGPGHTSIQISPDTSSGLSTERYKSQYEANLSPFAAFRGRESARAYKLMSVPERMIFSITRIVLATRTSRNIFAGYLFALHFLIFFMLSWSGTTEIEKRAVSLGAAGIASRAITSNVQSHNNGEWQAENFRGG